MKYKKKPVIIEAIQWTGTNIEQIKEFIGDSFCGSAVLANKYSFMLIKTLEGMMNASVNDYIIKGVDGEFYPCKPDIFAKTYTPVTDSSSEVSELIDKDELIRMIKYSSQYNKPCPDWVYGVIKNMTDRSEVNKNE